MTDQEIITKFEDEILPRIFKNSGEDQIAADQEFANWTDVLCSDGEITSEQCDKLAAPDYTDEEWLKVARKAANL